MGTRLEYDHAGRLRSRTPAARAPGTTVCLRALFSPLPVRRAEFVRHAKRELGKLLGALQAHALARPPLRLVVTHAAGRSPRTTLLATPGTGAARDALVAVFGPKAASEVVPFVATFRPSPAGAHAVSGFLSAPDPAGRVCRGGGGGEHRQFVSLNGRPVDAPRIVRALNAAFRAAHPGGGAPCCVLDFALPPELVDVNVSPDKRVVLIVGEDALMEDFDAALATAWPPQQEARAFAPRGAGAGGAKKRGGAQPPTPPPPGGGDSAGASGGDTTDVEEGEGEEEEEGEGGAPSQGGGGERAPKRARTHVGGAPGPPHRSPRAPPPLRLPRGAQGRGDAPQPQPQHAPRPPAAATPCEIDGDAPGDAPAFGAAGKRRGRDAFNTSNRTLVFDRDATRVRLLSPAAACARVCVISPVRQGARLARASALLASGAESTTARAFAASSLHAGADAGATLSDASVGNEEAAAAELERCFSKSDFLRLRVVGQFNLGFILAVLGNDLFIIDQHASDEIYNFERLQRTTALNKQPLIVPQALELTAAEAQVVMSNLATFKLNGFEIESHAPPGDGQASVLRLTAVPFSKNTTFGAADVHELVALLHGQSGASADAPAGPFGTLEGGVIRPAKVRSMLAMRACRCSIMIGRALDRVQMERVLHHLATLRAPWSCPHGRPTMRHACSLQRQK